MTRSTTPDNSSLPSQLPAVGQERGLLRNARGAELLHEAEHVLLPPVLDELSVFEADDRDAADGDRLACRGDVLEGTRVPRAHLPTPAGAVAVGQSVPDLVDG